MFYFIIVIKIIFHTIYYYWEPWKLLGYEVPSAPTRWFVRAPTPGLKPGRTLQHDCLLSVQCKPYLRQKIFCYCPGLYILHICYQQETSCQWMTNDCFSNICYSLVMIIIVILLMLCTYISYSVSVRVHVKSINSCCYCCRRHPHLS